MSKVFTVIVSAVILAGAYYVSFGAPAFLGLDTDTGTQTAGVKGGPPTNGPAGGGRGARATTVVLTALEMQPYEDILQAVGSADALHSADVITNVSGEVIKINLVANQQVKAGEVLVQLDARTQVFNLEIAQTESEQASDTAQRYERLRATGNSTVTDVTMSDARIAQRLAEAKVGLAQAALDDRTIRAPISGKMGLSDIKIGDILSNEDFIVTVDDSEAMLVEFELPERAVGLLSQGQDVLTSTPSFAGKVFEGVIVSFDSRIDSVTRSVTVRARIENPDGLLWPGMTFGVRVVRESEPLAMVPSTAITWSRSGSSVWIDQDGTAEQVAATILFRRDDHVWITADISPGTMVVTEGAQKLRPGARITVARGAKEAPATDKPATDKPATERPATAPGRAVPEVGRAVPETPRANREPA